MNISEYVKDGEIFSIMVAVQLKDDQWKAKVVHGQYEDEYAYGYNKSSALRNLREKIENRSKFQGHRFLDMECV